MKCSKTTVLRNGGVVLRRISNRTGTVSLVLDMHKDGQRKREWLGPHFLQRGVDKREDSKRLKLAIAIANQRAHEVRDMTYGLHSLTLRKCDFVQFYRKLAEETTGGIRVRSKTWLASSKHLMHFTNGKPVPFIAVSHQFCGEYREYLKQHLKANSARLYFSQFKASLNEAVRRQILPSNPAAYVCGIRAVDSNKCYLSKEEQDILTNTPCSDPMVKSAFLFQCHTGLRLCDVKTLKWKHIQDNVVCIRQQKTQRTVKVPLNATATTLAGPRKAAEDAVFALPSGDHVTRKIIRKWTILANIDKTVTPHVARHTFASNLSSSGTPFHIIAKLLGHVRLTTTQSYCHVPNVELVRATKSLDVGKTKQLDQHPPHSLL